MSFITLQAIKAEHNKLAAMISAFEAQKPVKYGIPAVCIELQPGAQYAGLVLDEDGEPSHHLILLPGEAESIDFNAAVVWAVEQGGDLPNRQEQSLLFANLKKHFTANYYWSGEVYSSGSAWCQYFSHGYQNYNDKDDMLRARAVRRLPI